MSSLYFFIARIGLGSVLHCWAQILALLKPWISWIWISPKHFIFKAWLGSTVTVITEPSKALESLNGPDKFFQQSDKTYAYWSSAGKARVPKSQRRKGQGPFWRHSLRRFLCFHLQLTSRGLVHVLLEPMHSFLKIKHWSNKIGDGCSVSRPHVSSVFDKHRWPEACY